MVTFENGKYTMLNSMFLLFTFVFDATHQPFTAFFFNLSSLDSSSSHVTVQIYQENVMFRCTHFNLIQIYLVENYEMLGRCIMPEIKLLLYTAESIKPELR